MAASSTKVGPSSPEGGAEDPTSKSFQEKYYPISPSFINKYDPYTLQSTIDEELTKVSNPSNNLLSLTCHFLCFASI